MQLGCELRPRQMPGPDMQVKRRSSYETLGGISDRHQQANTFASFSRGNPDRLNQIGIICQHHGYIE